MATSPIPSPPGLEPHKPVAKRHMVSGTLAPLYTVFELKLGCSGAAQRISAHISPIWKPAQGFYFGSIDFHLMEIVLFQLDTISIFWKWFLIQLDTISN